jgi:hypothetical protein
MSNWALFWLVWVAVGVVAEFAALSRPAKGDTLSEQVWSVLASPTYGKFAAWMLSAFLLWMIVHFASKGRLG